MSETKVTMKQARKMYRQQRDQLDLNSFRKWARLAYKGPECTGKLKAVVSK